MAPDGPIDDGAGGDEPSFRSGTKDEPSTRSGTEDGPDAAPDAPTAVEIDSQFLEPYARFSLYNSPYRAHDEGRAVDCYPEPPGDERTTVAPSPVGGTVREIRSVRAPPKPYAADRDHLVVLECDAPTSVAGLTARVLHVEPAVEVGDRVAPGEDLGTLVRAGFFAPWVDNHLHVGFRSPDRDPLRASGSLPIHLAVPVRPLEWDGTGTVVDTGATYATLDAPAHPNPGHEFVGIAADRAPVADGTADSGSGGEDGVLDGGLPHYDGGGLLGGSDTFGRADGPVGLWGKRLGVARGRTLAWDDVTVTANGAPVTGLSCFCARDDAFGAKLICPAQSLAVGSDVRVRLER